MDVYKDMYFYLFCEMTEMIKKLQDAQKYCEQVYMKAKNVEEGKRGEAADIEDAMSYSFK